MPSCRPNPISRKTAKFAYGESRDSPMEIARGANAIKRRVSSAGAIKRGFFYANMGSARAPFSRERGF